jgi:hypothetical protein
VIVIRNFNIYFRPLKSAKVNVTFSNGYSASVSVTWSADDKWFQAKRVFVPVAAAQAFTATMDASVTDVTLQAAATSYQYMYFVIETVKVGDNENKQFGCLTTCARVLRDNYPQTSPWLTAYRDFSNSYDGATCYELMDRYPYYDIAFSGKCELPPQSVKTSR